MDNGSSFMAYNTMIWLLKDAVLLMKILHHKLKAGFRIKDQINLMTRLFKWIFFKQICICIKPTHIPNHIHREKKELLISIFS